MIRYFFLLLGLFSFIIARNPFAFEWQDSCIAKAHIEEQQLSISFHKKDGTLKTHIIKKAPST